MTPLEQYKYLCKHGFWPGCPGENIPAWADKIMEETGCHATARPIIEYAYSAELDALSSRIAELEAQLKIANELISYAFAELTDAPEINPCNYNHDQVCRLNTQCCSAYSILYDYANTIGGKDV